jgi:NADPH-dependent curcumin reductase
MSNMNRQWRLMKRPVGEDFDECLVFGEEPIGVPGDGQILVKNLHISLDPANRVWMNEGDSYKAPVPLGGVMEAFCVSKVAESKNPDFAVGDVLYGFGNWEDFSVTDGSGWEHAPDIGDAPFSAHLGVFSVVGPTAYVGLLDVCDPQPGETVVVTTAAGAVGSLVGQIAKIKGCRVVGLTGSDEKCKWMTEDLGYDAAINYKTESVYKALSKHCPDGIDCHFEQVGDAKVLDTVLTLLNHNGRISLCGWISGYNATAPVPGPVGLANLVMKRGKMEGFIVLDYPERIAQSHIDMRKWIAEDKLKYRVDVVDDLTGAVEALHTLYAGTNQGKLIVKVQDDPLLD